MKVLSHQLGQIMKNIIFCCIHCSSQVYYNVFTLSVSVKGTIQIFSLPSSNTASIYSHTVSSFYDKSKEYLQCNADINKSFTQLSDLLGYFSSGEDLSTNTCCSFKLIFHSQYFELWQREKNMAFQMYTKWNCSKHIRFEKLLSL